MLVCKVLSKTKDEIFRWFLEDGFGPPPQIIVHEEKHINKYLDNLESFITGDSQTQP